MTPLKKLLLGISIASAVLAAIGTDYDAYKKAKKADPTARFGWLIATQRVLNAIVVGSGVGLGAGYGAEAAS